MTARTGFPTCAVRPRARAVAACAGVMVIAAGLTACHTQHPPKTSNFASTLPEEIPEVGAANGAIYQSGHDQELFDNGWRAGSGISSRFS